MADDRIQQQAWLAELRDGTAFLPDATPSGGQSFAQIAERGSSAVATPVFDDALPAPGVCLPPWSSGW